jgi:hypothetical protein
MIVFPALFSFLLAKFGQFYTILLPCWSNSLSVLSISFWFECMGFLLEQENVFLSFVALHQEQCYNNSGQNHKKKIANMSKAKYFA